jgi:hypothetical protein
MHRIKNTNSKKLQFKIKIQNLNSKLKKKRKEEIDNKLI